MLGENLSAHQETEPETRVVLSIDRQDPLRQHALISPYVGIEPMPVILLHVDEDAFRGDLADSASVLEYADVVFVDTGSVSAFTDLYSGSSDFFRRYPKTKAVIHFSDEETTVYTPTEATLYKHAPRGVAEVMEKMSEAVVQENGKWQKEATAVITRAVGVGTNDVVSSENETLWRESLAQLEKPETVIFRDKKTEIRQELREAIANGNIPPFVYTYPPRSAYRKLPEGVTIDDIWDKDRTTSPNDETSLYLHFPFCKYKCGFCNLYTVANANEDMRDAYVDTLADQIRQSEPILEGRKLATIYIGGGTPMLMSRGNFDQIVGAITEVAPDWRDTVGEFCMEASPDSIVNAPDKDIVKYLVDQGLTRTNLGLQSTEDAELLHMGRPITAKTGWEAIATLKKAGLQNLSTDLIMGFEDQTEESWIKSVKDLLAHDPETISTYFLTVRPDNRFGRTGRYTFYRDPKLYRWYDRARELIIGEGYEQESNVRYIKPGQGGYEQKVKQFHGVPILGLGAGARSYTNTADYIIGGDSKPSLRQIHEYMRSVKDGNVAIKAGYVYDDEERIRKRFALDLFQIDLAELDRYNIEAHLPKFQPLLDVLVEEGLVEREGETKYKMTPSGNKYRDIISWMFFSPTVIQRDIEFYQTLAKGNLITPG
ncbi:MAG: radical SAM protein [Candidatus Levybacteria bacterium]|nr:radical SAM protein [Candidatus Levybacteria bacterium]